MKQAYLLIIFFCFFSVSAYSQAGIQFYAGATSVKNRDITITPADHAHSGYHFGVDARLNEGKMFFGGGLEYANISFNALKNKNYFSVENSMEWFKIRIGLGYRLLDFGKKTSLRAKTYGSVNMITNYPKNMTDVPYANYNSGTAAAVLGLGMDVYSFTIDFEYERGFFNAVNLVKNTEVDFYKLSLGFKI